MKGALEAAMVVVLLAMGALIVRERLAAGRPAAARAAHAGADVEIPGTVPPGNQTYGVTGIPPIRLSSPPKPMRRRAVVPPPVAP